MSKSGLADAASSAGAEIYCPLCAYNLYNEPGESCPECGSCLATDVMAAHTSVIPTLSQPFNASERMTQPSRSPLVRLTDRYYTAPDSLWNGRPCLDHRSKLGVLLSFLV
jgi:hypothetical protein